MTFHASSDAVFQIGSTPFAVRDGLRDILGHPVMACQSDGLRGDAQMVLAEALNNIVEHAYHRADQSIALRMSLRSNVMAFEICDDGLPMPDLRLPEGLPQPIDSFETLPEGGFGWFIIRSLTENLTYQRIGARNHMSFQLKIEQ